MNMPRLLLPVTAFSLLAITSPVSSAVTVYDFDQDGMSQTSVEQISLLRQLFQRFTITFLPASDPGLLRVHADGDLRSATEIYEILEADRRITDLNSAELVALLVVMESKEFASFMGKEPLIPEPQAKPFDGTISSLVRTPPAVCLKTAMVLLERLALQDPAEALARFNALAPSLASACLAADGPTPVAAETRNAAAGAGNSFTFAHVLAGSGAPQLSSFPQDSDPPSIEPMAYLNASGDLAAFAQALAVKDPVLAVKWYSTQRSTGLYEADQGFTRLLADIAGRDLFEAFIVVGGLAGRDQEDAATGIVASAANPTQWVMLVEALRQPRATAVRGVVLRSLGHDLALRLPPSLLSSWYVKSGFSAGEQKLLQEGAVTRQPGDPNDPVERYRFRDHRLDGWNW